MGELDFGVKPNGFRVIALGREWTRNAQLSQVHGLIQFTRDGVDMEDGVRGFTMGEGGIQPLESDLQEVQVGTDENEEPIMQTETIRAAQMRFFSQLHEQAGNATEAVLSWLKQRLSKNLVKGLW